MSISQSRSILWIDVSGFFVFFSLSSTLNNINCTFLRNNRYCFKQNELCSVWSSTSSRESRRIPRLFMVLHDMQTGIGSGIVGQLAQGLIGAATRTEKPELFWDSERSERSRDTRGFGNNNDSNLASKHLYRTLKFAYLGTQRLLCCG